MKNPPNVSCVITAKCIVNPSEDKSKLEIALSNILSNTNAKATDTSAQITTKDISSLEKIYESIHSRNTQRIYNKQLRKNLTGESTFLYLNKQAAFMNAIAICNEENESPLGAIKLTLTSKNVDLLIEWLIS